MSIDPTLPEYPLPKYEYDPPPGCLVVLAIVIVATALAWLIGVSTGSTILALILLPPLVIAGIVASIHFRVLGAAGGCGCIWFYLLLGIASGVLIVLLKPPPQ